MLGINPAEAAALGKAEREAWWFRGMREVLFRLLDPLVAGRSIGRVVEAGWGTGYFARLLQSRYDWRVFPLALGWEGVCGVERLSRADPCALPFVSGSFDAVFSIDLLGNVPPGGEREPLAELTRLLAPKGLLVVRVGAFDLFRSRHSEYLRQQQRYTRPRLIALAESCGLRVLRVSYVNALLAPLALAKFRVCEPFFRSPPSSRIDSEPWWLDRLLYMPLALESYWLGAGLNLPIGQTLLLIGERAA
ncbi:MAG TPA: class I SAM-dependent methyltransferase [Bryobacteraceae bacterium]